MSNKPDLDAIAAMCATEAADPLALSEHVPALLALARRTEEAEVSWRALVDDHTEVCAALGRASARAEQAEAALAEERARLADQAAAHEEQLRHQAAVAERVAANATKERTRAERAERERDEAQRRGRVLVTVDGSGNVDVTSIVPESSSPARPPLDPAHVKVLRGMLDEERASLAAASDEIRPYWEQRIAALGAVLGEEVKP